MPADYKTLLGLVREFVENIEQWERGQIYDGIPKEFIDRARAAIAPSEPKNDPTIAHTHVSDACCSKPIMKAMRDGLLDDKAQWCCPKCDTEWIMQVVNGVHHWRPQPQMVTFR
jgi:hypothetical protein